MFAQLFKQYATNTNYKGTRIYSCDELKQTATSVSI